MYEGYESANENCLLDEEHLQTPTADVSSSRTQECQPKLMEDDSHSGNCSYDADASNDSIELNLSLDEQQPETQNTPYTNHTQSNQLPVSVERTFSHYFHTRILS